MDMLSITRLVDEIRVFNRFYTRQIGLLEEGLLKSGFPLTEARIIFELGSRDDGGRTGISPSILVADLGIDPGYLSRIIRKFEDQNLIVKRRSVADGRQIEVTLSADGHAVFEQLDRASQQATAALLEPLSKRDRQILVRAMQTIELVLTPVATCTRPSITPDVSGIDTMVLAD